MLGQRTIKLSLLVLSVTVIGFRRHRRAGGSMIEGKEVRDEPLDVLSEDGNVAVAGPGGMIMLSPKAAEEPSDRLWNWAMTVRREQKRTQSSDQ
jgi:hypothetical protein